MGTINADNIKSADGGNTVKVGTAFQGNNLHDRFYCCKSAIQ